MKPPPAGPDVDLVVDGYEFAVVGSEDPGYLSSLAAANLIDVSYYLPRRAYGDFRAYLDANPSLPRAKLERSVIVRVADAQSLSSVLSAAPADGYVESATVPMPYTFSVLMSRAADSPKAIAAGYAHPQLMIDTAWKLTGGHAFIGFVDTGLSTQHPQLAAFASSGRYLGGPFLPVASLDLGRWPTTIDANVDELEPFLTANSQCDGDGDGKAIPVTVGHGTHTAGLAAANFDQKSDVSGACKHCSIGMMKILRHVCSPQGDVIPAMNNNAVGIAITALTDAGAQVINMSLGTQPTSLQFCSTAPNDAACLALAYATERGVVIVAASGNDRDRLKFPARDTRVVAVGGTDATQLLWNEDKDAAPNNLDGCPTSGNPAECGSNYTTLVGEPRQQTVAAAQFVKSTIVAGHQWGARCSDASDGTPNDGVGLCTGTSMSAPLISGLVGLLRSINPLIGVGNPDSMVVTPGVRNVLAETSAAAQIGIGWTAEFGHGLPDAGRAARRIIGTVGGVVARNRATPLFSFQSAGFSDHAYATTPQMASALLRNQMAKYAPVGQPIAGYANFPGIGGGTPGADAFVLATEKPLSPADPLPKPLFLLDRERFWPAGCSPLNPPCDITNRDFLLAASVQDLETLVAEGFQYRGMQGYVHAPCTPEPSCMPTGTQRLYRECRVADDDCAVFLEHQRASFNKLGFVSPAYAGAPIVLGYAYPNIDTDADLLADGVELVAGTNPNDADSDDDGLSDGAEYPLAQLPLSDPCGGGATSCHVTLLFDDSFE